MQVAKVIGSSSISDIILTGKYVSERHAILTEEEGRTFIEDLNSTFGTHVNGKQIDKRTELIDKDRVKIGTQNFHWSDHVGEQEPEKNPIYLNDLFSPSGLVNWQDYKVILLLALGFVIVMPIGVPAFLSFVEHRMNRLGNSEVELMQYVEPLIWILSIIAGYIFINLTQKTVRAFLTKTN